MDNEGLVFSNQENRDLFKTDTLIGKKLKLNKYTKIFKDKKLINILKSLPINETVDAFIKGGLNLTKASANSYVHRNTLIYRLEKINRAIGLDLRNFEDCLIFVNVREVYRMVNR
jgi:DNA-binding PucR family transcriptional regulator